MIRFELIDGRIVDAVKDCSCITHDGPCWVNADRVWREVNWGRVRSLQAAGIEPTWLDARGLAIEELPRLRAKRDKDWPRWERTSQHVIDELAELEARMNGQSICLLILILAAMKAVSAECKAAAEQPKEAML